MDTQGSPVLDPTARAAVVARLDGVRREHHVEIPLAVESGSRAWGFPSPDSDYDCRFVYVRSEVDYLDPWPARDVIETPLDAVLDVNGWDLIKAVRLAVKGNATVAEWVSSPLTYAVDPHFRQDLAGLVEEVADRSALTYHYAHIAITQRDRWFAAGDVPLKKVFYAVRPAAVLRWLRTHPRSVLAPIELDVLLAEGEAPAAVIAAAGDLTARKARTREMGSGPVPGVLADFVESELSLVAPKAARSDAGRARQVGADWFRAALARYGPR